MNRELSDEQLVRIVRGLAALHLEIERGVRDPEVLGRTDGPPSALHLASPTPSGAATTGRRRPRHELGPVHLRRSEHGRVFATVTTPTQTNRWGALTFVLDIQQGRVAIRQIQRLHARGDYGRTSPRATPPNEVPLEEQIRRVRTDLNQASSALEAVTRRLDELPAAAINAGGHHNPRQLAARGRPRGRLQLNRELADLDEPASSTNRTQPARGDAVNPSPVDAL
jgi:hypothetical protein